MGKVYTETIVGNSLREQSIVLAALNNFFEDEPDSFTNLAENIIHSLECESESDFSDISMQIKSANVFSDLPTKFMKYFLLLLFISYCLLSLLSEMKF